MGLLVLESPVFLGVIIVLEFHGFEAFMDQVHVILPDPAGPGCALQISDTLRLVAAYPYCCCIVMGKSAEPSVLGFIRSSGLAGCDLTAGEPEPTACSPAFFQYALKHADHLPSGIFIIHLGRRSVIRIDGVSSVVVDPADTGRNSVFTVIENCAIACCHLHRLNAVGESAQRCREHIVGIHDHGEMHGLKFGQTVLGCDVLVDLPCDCIEGSLNRFSELELTHVVSAGVLGTVLDLFVHDICSGIIFLFKSGCIHHQRLDRTAGLPVALECAVKSERRFCILGSAADHGYDLAGAVVDANGRALHLVFSVVRCILEISQFFIHAVLEHLLLLQVKGSIDLVAALIQFRKACIVQLVVQFVISRALFIACEIIAEGEVRILDLHQDFRRALICITDHISVLVPRRFTLRGEIKHDLFLNRLVVFLLSDQTVFEHILQDQISSLNCAVRVGERIVVSRAVGNRAQESDLRKIQLIGSLVKITLTGGCDSVITIHEIYIVEIELKDLVLAVLFLQIPGDKDLFHLSLPGSSVVEEDSSGQLHGDRTAALCDLPVNDKFLRRANNRLVIYAAVLIKVLVLDADHCVLEQIGDLARRQVIGVLFRKGLRDQVPRRVIDLACLRRDERLLAGFAYEGVRLILHSFDSAIIAAKIENAENCQYTYKDNQYEYL